MGGNDCVGVGIHASEVGDDKAVGKRDSKQDKLRCRVQIGC